jgi:hypothetical protein
MHYVMLWTWKPGDEKQKDTATLIGAVTNG